MITLAVRVYRFNAAHHLEDGSQCARMHGHNYELHVKLRRVSYTPTRPFVMMFDKMDTIIDPIIDGIDHRFMVGFETIDKHDPYFETYPERCVQIPVDSITTERMAEYLAGLIQTKLQNLKTADGLKTDVCLHSVLLWETPRNYAEVIINEE